jgi:hypothetical protein
MPLQAQFGGELCDKHDDGGCQMKGRKCSAFLAIQVLAGRRSAMACITSAKPPGTNQGQARAAQHCSRLSTSTSHWYHNHPITS